MLHHQTKFKAYKNPIFLHVFLVIVLILFCVISSVSGATGVDDIPVPDQLRSDTTFLRYDTDLDTEGYAVSGFTVRMNPDNTVVTVSYTRADGKEAILSADMTNDSVTKITLEKEEEPLWPLLLTFLCILVVCAVSGYYLYTRYVSSMPVEEPVTETEIQDSHTKAEELLRQAEQARDRNDLKTAYGLAGRALRIYISEQYGNGTEETNMEIIHVYQETGKKTDTIQNVLDTCSFVEFARKNGDSDELSSIVSVIRGLI